MRLAEPAGKEQDLRTWHVAAPDVNLDDGDVLAVAIADHKLLLVRSGGTVYAIADRCSHADQELACGMVRNGWISCPAHGARFALANGEPLNPPATAAIATYPVRVVAGELQVCLPSEA